MGQRVDDTVRIQAGPEDVYDVIADLPVYPEWAEGVRSVEVLATTDDGLPLRAAFSVDARIAEISYTLEYQHQHPGLMTWRLVEGDLVTQMDGRYELTAEGDSTHVHYSLEVDLSLPMPGFMIKRGARTILDLGLRGLRDRTEGR